MKCIFKILFSLLLPGLASLPIWAQRNIFNVPQAEIIEPHKIFFQEQLSVTNQVQSSTTLTFGLVKSWEIGLNVNNMTLKYRPVHQRMVELRSEKPEENPDVTLNIQKGIHLAEWFDLGIGTRTGAGYVGELSYIKLANFSYFNTQFNIKKYEIKVYGGGYYTTPAYAGEGNTIGYMAGLIVPLINEKLYFVGDYLSGTNMLSNVAGGVSWQFSKKWQVGAGAQIPSPGSRNSYGAILQLTNR